MMAVFLGAENCHRVVWPADVYPAVLYTHCKAGVAFVEL